MDKRLVEVQMSADWLVYDRKTTAEDIEEEVKYLASKPCFKGVEEAVIRKELKAYVQANIASIARKNDLSRAA